MPRWEQIRRATAAARSRPREGQACEHKPCVPSRWGWGPHRPSRLSTGEAGVGKTGGDAKGCASEASGQANSGEATSRLARPGLREQAPPLSKPTFFPRGPFLPRSPGAPAGPPLPWDERRTASVTACPPSGPPCLSPASLPTPRRSGQSSRAQSHMRHHTPQGKRAWPVRPCVTLSQHADVPRCRSQRPSLP